jgi:hypothetical protein
MKKRIGFVSNSSSSSFVFIGRRIDIKEAEELIKSGKNNIIADTNQSGGDGDIIMETIDVKILNVLKRAVNNEWGEDCVPTLYEVFAASGSDSYSLEFNPTDLPPITLTIYNMNIDYHNPGSAEELEEFYNNRFGM